MLSKYQEQEKRIKERGMKGKKGVEREDYSRSVKEVRASNTPSSRDSIEFESKYVLKK